MAPWSRRKFLGSLGVTGGAILTGGAAGPILRSSPSFNPRSVAKVVPPLRTQVGEVFQVRRTFPTRAFDHVDPFLLLDHFDFTMAPGELGGLAPHPHRGFETVTVLLDGAIEHGDCLGNRGRIEDGDVQWMTAGSGIVHEENPDDIIRERGGRILGLQLWVNLPRRSKWIPPAYKDKKAADIPIVTGGGVRARVIAGEVHGVRGAIGTHTPLALVDYTLDPGAEVSLSYPLPWSAFLHVIEGTMTLGSQRVGPAHLALLAHDGEGIHLANETPRVARLVLGGGEALGEPVARHGPFVMNTQAELRQAVEDYRSGQMGRVAKPTYDRIRKR